MHHEPKPLGDELKRNFKAGSLALGVLEKCFTPFTRNHFGTRGLGFTTPAAFVLLMFIAQESSSPQVTAYLYLWCAMVIWRKLTPDRAQISYHAGFPWAANWATLGLIKDEFRLRTVEALLIGGLGHLMSPSPLGKFFLIAMPLLAGKSGLDRYFVQRQREAWEDARKLARQQHGGYR